MRLQETTVGIYTVGFLIFTIQGYFFSFFGKSLSKPLKDDIKILLDLGIGIIFRSSFQSYFLGSIQFWCGSGPWIRTGKKMDPDSDPGHFFKIYWIFLTTKKFKFSVLFFSLILILKLDEPFRNEEIFIISLFWKVQIWGFGEKKRFFSFWIRIRGSAYFCGSGSRKQNLADPTDPDPKHWTLWVTLHYD